MDYTKQAEDMIKMWTDAQRRAWDTMLTASRSFGGGQATGMWEKSVEALEESVKNVFRSQREWTKLWAEQLDSMKAPEELRTWAHQAQESLKTLADAQVKLWSEWFRVMRTLSPEKASGMNWQGEAEKFMRSWQDAMRNATEAQLEWARTWKPSGAKQPSDKTEE